MTDKEKLEKLVAYLMRKIYAHNQMADIGSTGEIFDEKIENAKYEECKDTLNFIDTMEEEPVSEDLEEAVNAYIGYAPEVDESSSTYGKRQAFKAGAEWQKQQMMKNAVKGGCFSYRNGYKHISCDIDEKLTDIKFGDKIKVIVIKEG